jgi:hypothetical protein
MHVAQLSTDDRNRRLRSSIAKGDQVRIHPKDERVVFVSSESRPGLWHYSRADFCDCIGFTQRGMCRHAVRASWELWKEKNAANELPPAA